MGGKGGDATFGSGGGGGAGGRLAIYAVSHSFAGATLVSGGSMGAGTSPGGTAQDGTDYAGTLVESPGTIIFNSSTVTDGAIGGLSGADAMCQTSASNVGMSGRWRALLSTSDVAAKDRIGFVGAVYDRTHTEIAAQSADLWAGLLLNAVGATESGSIATSDAWTGSLPDGTSAATCNNWQSAAGGDFGTVGDYTLTGGDWLTKEPVSCNATRSLYCVTR